MKEQLATLQDSEKGHTEALQLLQRQLTETKVSVTHRAVIQLQQKSFSLFLEFITMLEKKHHSVPKPLGGVKILNE